MLGLMARSPTTKGGANAYALVKGTRTLQSSPSIGEAYTFKLYQLGKIASLTGY